MEHPVSRPNLAFVYVTSLFFTWGFITATLDVLVPLVRSIFTLSYSESLLTQFAFFLSYGLVSLPASSLVSRRGSSSSIIIALIVVMLGFLIIPLATSLRAYPLFLLALFVIGSGITLLQVAANPLAAALGPPERSHLRLTLSQAFNSLGTAVAPIVGSIVMLRGGVFSGGGDEEANRVESLGHIDLSSLFAIVVLVALTFGLWRVRHLLTARNQGPAAESQSPFEALNSRWAVGGAIGIFLYVGAEVSIGSILINFLVQPSILNVSYETAGKWVAYYWSGAMLGRFVGSLLMTRIRASHLLTGAALVAGVLCLTVSQMTGEIAAIAALSIGLFNSIMFPTIFTLTLERSSAPPAATSGLLCMAIVGGALLPQLVGRVADMAGLSITFLVPAAAYFGIVLFAAATSRKTQLRLVEATAPH